MSEDPLAVLGGRLHVRYGLDAAGEPLYLFGAAAGTSLDTLRSMLRAAGRHLDQLEARGEMTA